MAKKKKIEVTEQLEQIFIGDKITIKDLISNLQKMKNRHFSRGYKNLEIDIIYEGYGDDGYTEHWIFGTRLETDKEYERRMEKEIKQRERNQKRRETKEQQEIKELQKLMKKYPNEIRV